MRSAANVARTDSAIAPPTCIDVFTRPDAMPESCGVAPDIARPMIDGKLRPAPKPSRSIDGSMLAT